MVRTLTRLENAAILILCLISFYELYGIRSFGWPLSLFLFLAPDLSLVGKLVNDRVGAIAYNLVHNYAFTFILLLLGMLDGGPLAVLMPASLLFTAHAGMDRMLGLGMKYPGTKETHVQRV